MAIDPAVALALTPARRRGQPGESLGDDAELLVLARPDRAPRLEHHLVRPNPLIASPLVEKFTFHRI